MISQSKCDVINNFIAPKIAGLVTIIDNHSKLEFYSGGDLHYLYHYLYMIGSSTILNYSGYNSHYFEINSNTDTECLNPFIFDLSGLFVVVVDVKSTRRTVASLEFQITYIQVYL